MSRDKTWGIDFPCEKWYIIGDERCDGHNQMINRIPSGRYGAYRPAARKCLAILKRGGFFIVL